MLNKIITIALSIIGGIAIAILAFAVFVGVLCFLFWSLPSVWILPSLFVLGRILAVLGAVVGFIFHHDIKIATIQ